MEEQKQRSDTASAGLLRKSKITVRHTKPKKELRKQNKQVESVKQIRASVITRWLNVYNLLEVQYLAEHQYVSSTENYLINDLEDLKEDINKYHPIG